MGAAVVSACCAGRTSRDAASCTVCGTHSHTHDAAAPATHPPPNTCRQLFTQQDPAQQEALCSELLQLRPERVARYLLQVVYLAVARPSGPLERAVTQLCGRCFATAVQVCARGALPPPRRVDCLRCTHAPRTRWRLQATHTGTHPPPPPPRHISLPPPPTVPCAGVVAAAGAAAGPARQPPHPAVQGRLRARGTHGHMGACVRACVWGQHRAAACHDAVTQ